MDSRYEISLQWANTAEESGRASVVHAGTNNTGMFRFFNPDNWEVLVKVLDGCESNGHHWVFAAAATSLGLDLAVTDTVTGRSRTYVTEPNNAAPAVTDVQAFPDGCRQ